uniref:Uncharacterized protein n=1 Tax=Amphimedon queenslandica TaxID=400682 RepID=A0A1X7V2G2_AMPQE
SWRASVHLLLRHIWSLWYYKKAEEASEPSSCLPDSLFAGSTVCFLSGCHGEKERPA